MIAYFNTISQQPDAYTRSEATSWGLFLPSGSNFSLAPQENEIKLRRFCRNGKKYEVSLMTTERYSKKILLTVDFVLTFLLLCGSVTLLAIRNMFLVTNEL